MANRTLTLPVIPALGEGALSWGSYLVPVVLLYPIVCSVLRFRRRDAMRKKFNYSDKASLSRMTNVDAQAIIEYIAELEFPKLFEMSLQFALFKTYGIPTISGLLTTTKEFSSAETANKRLADTSTLIREFCAFEPKHDRVIKAIARMNYIHSRYIKAGKISNTDLLYTLSVFVTEPIAWIGKYEWRDFTDMECCAIATFWKSIGDAMGIEYKGHLARSEWTDGLEFYKDLKEWAEGYERDFMVPAYSNKKTADELVPILLFYVPEVLKGPAAHMVGVLMTDRLRAAMMYSTPSKTYFKIVNTILATRRFLLRWLALPRPSFMSVRLLTDQDPQTGRFYLSSYQVFPYYVKPSFWNRWGPEAWLVWAAGGRVPGSDEKFEPKGYVFSEVGPKGMRGKGGVETEAIESKLRSERPSGCPFARY